MPLTNNNISTSCNGPPGGGRCLHAYDVPGEHPHRLGPERGRRDRERGAPGVKRTERTRLAGRERPVRTLRRSLPDSSRQREDPANNSRAVSRADRRVTFATGSKKAVTNGASERTSRRTAAAAAAVAAAVDPPNCATGRRTLTRPTSSPGSERRAAASTSVAGAGRSRRIVCSCCEGYAVPRSSFASLQTVVY